MTTLDRIRLWLDLANIFRRSVDDARANWCMDRLKEAAND